MDCCGAGFRARHSRGWPGHPVAERRCLPLMCLMSVHLRAQVPVLWVTPPMLAGQSTWPTRMSLCALGKPLPGPLRAVGAVGVCAWGVRHDRAALKFVYADSSENGDALEARSGWSAAETCHRSVLVGAPGLRSLLAKAHAVVRRCPVHCGHEEHAVQGRSSETCCWWPLRDTQVHRCHGQATVLRRTSHLPCLVLRLKNVLHTL